MINSVSSVFCKLIRFLLKSFQSLLHCSQWLAVLLPVQRSHMIGLQLSVNIIVRPYLASHHLLSASLLG